MQTSIKLQELTIKNFQSIKGETSISLSGLTVLVGPNSAGKSAILDALEALQTLTDPSFASKLQSQHGEKAEIAITFRLRYPNKYWREPHFNKNKLIDEMLEQFSGNDLTIRVSANRFTLQISGSDAFSITKLNLEYVGLAGLVKYFLGDTDLFDEFMDDHDSFDDSRVNFPATYTTKYVTSKKLLYGRYDIDSEKSLIAKDNVLMKGQSNINSEKLVFYGIQDEWRGGPLDISAPVQHPYSFNELEDDLADYFVTSFKKTVRKALDENSNKRKKFEKHFCNEETRKKYVKQCRRLSEVSDSAAAEMLEIANSLSVLLEEKLQESFSHINGSRTIIDSTGPILSLKTDPLKNCPPQRVQMLDSIKRDNIVGSLAELYCYALLQKIDIPSAIFESPDSLWDSVPELNVDVVNQWVKRYLPSMSTQKIIPIFTETKQILEKNSDLSESYEQYENDPYNHGTDDPYDFLYLKLDIYLRILSKEKRIQNFSDVGSGYSFIFPILLSLWASKLSFIEQPELHLHPKLQGELGDVFIAALTEGNASIIETHSEHILLRFLRRIRETSSEKKPKTNLRLMADKLNIYFFEPKKNGTIVKKIRVDENGEFLNLWPGGFFTEREKDIFS